MASQVSEVAAIHSKLDQILAAYASANTPRGITPPPSIFSAASDTHTPAGAAQLDTADSIMPGGKAAAGWDDAAAAESEAADSSALSPASRAAADDAAEMSHASDSAVEDAEPVAPTPKVKFLLNDDSVADHDSTADGEEADTAAAAKAPASPKISSKQSAWSRLRTKAATSSSETSGSPQRPVKPDVDAATMPPDVARSSSKASAPDSGSLDADSVSQDGLAPKPAVAASASSLSVSVGTSDTGDSASAPAAKPRSSLKRMLRRVLP